MDIFTIRLNKLLNETKMTKYRLAKTLGVSKQAVLFWCDGTNEPKISYLQKIAIIFDVTADYLLGLEDETGTKHIAIEKSVINSKINGNLTIK